MWTQASSARATLSFDEVVRRFEYIFDCPDHAGCASDRLFRIHQGSLLVAEYAVEFGTLAAESGWDEVALQAAFRRGLSRQVRDALITGAPSKGS